VDILGEVQRVLRGLTFKVDQIKVDAEDRPKKSPSAFCFSIQVPTDVRVVYKPVSPGTDLGSVFHEFGHGIHGISGRAHDPSWVRYVVPRSVAETFSFLFESLITNPLFLQEDLGFPHQVVQDIMDRRHFMNLYFAVFYSANSLMKLAYWHDQLSFDQASKYWQQLTKQFYTEIPGNYWLIHHIMANYDIYAPSYVLATIRVAGLRKQLVKEYGERWWHEPAAGKYIAGLAELRGDFPIKQFPLDPQIFLDEITQISFL
jgi:oligoendopeptidase F